MVNKINARQIETYDFNDYVLGDTKIFVEPGEMISCEENACDVEVAFSINGEKYLLRPGQSKNIDHPIIASIILHSASDYKKKLQAGRSYDWGMSKYSNYLLNFKGEDGSVPVSPSTTTTIMKMTKGGESGFWSFVAWLKSILF